jgi:phage gp46-like protein
MAESLTTGDIKFYVADLAVNTIDFADMKISGYKLLRDPGFETAVIISLFTDHRADDDDKVLNVGDTRRGWWADALLDVKIGSKLWLLGRAKTDNETLTLVEQYTKDALDWMITDGIADRIDSIATRNGANQIDFFMRIIKTDDRSVFFKFFVNWELQIAGGLV